MGLNNEACLITFRTEVNDFMTKLRFGCFPVNAEDYVHILVYFHVKHGFIKFTVSIPLLYLVLKKIYG